MLTATIGLLALSGIIALFGILSARNAARLARLKKPSERRATAPSDELKKPVQDQNQNTSPEMLNALSGSGQLRHNHR